NPKPHIIWKKSGVPLTTGYRYKVAYKKETGECRLEISMTFADDAGEYSVFAKNPLGEASATAILLDEGIHISLLCDLAGSTIHLWFNVLLFFFQEFMISAFEERIIQEIEIRILRITYRELVTEDGELMVTVAEDKALQPTFDTPVKNYRIMEGMGVTFHCRMSGTPLPKVQKSH
ncbi:hypothetical protein GOODEAATRI_000275, partial [Goodea atripinnis]